MRVFVRVAFADLPEQTVHVDPGVFQSHVQIGHAFVVVVPIRVVLDDEFECRPLQLCQLATGVDPEIVALLAGVDAVSTQFFRNHSTSALLASP